MTAKLAVSLATLGRFAPGGCRPQTPAGLRPALDPISGDEDPPGDEDPASGDGALPAMLAAFSGSPTDRRVDWRPSAPRAVTQKPAQDSLFQPRGVPNGDGPLRAISDLLIAFGPTLGMSQVSAA